MEFGLNLTTESMIVIGLVTLVYFIVITGYGTYFARYNRNINDFFYCGQRFSWWIAAASMVATGIGAYSYLKYSEQGYNTGMSSALVYNNDWFLVPFFLFGWLPILYFNKIRSIPEYFERRFNKIARYISMFIILAYMFFYIGYNFFTIGVAIEGIMGWPQMYTIPIVAILLGVYVTYGGQTAVIFTDLFQGIMIYIAGGLAIAAGIYALGGFDEFWNYLPILHRLPFPHLSISPKFNTTGLFWGEAVAGSIAFTFMNQGFIMRYLSLKSVREGRKAALFNVIVSGITSAIVIGAVGWIAKSLIVKQTLMGGKLEGLDPIHIKNTFHTFVIVCWETLRHNSWVFGFVVAALTAALMSTIDTLINACAAVGIYDIYKPLIKKDADDAHYLKAARVLSILSTFIGVLLVIWFNKQQGTLMSIHYKGIMMIIPPVVTTIFLGVFWKRFTAMAACVSMVGGSLLTVASVFYPSMIDHFASFVSAPQDGVYIYMRAMFGMVVTATIGMAVTLLGPADKKDIRGLTVDTIDYGIETYKGGKPDHRLGKKQKRLTVEYDETIPFEQIALSPEAKVKLKVTAGDLVYVSDNRWWLGGLRSEHFKVAEANTQNKVVKMSRQSFERAYLKEAKAVCVEKIF